VGEKRHSEAANHNVVIPTRAKRSGGICCSDAAPQRRKITQPGAPFCAKRRVGELSCGEAASFNYKFITAAMQRTERVHRVGCLYLRANKGVDARSWPFIAGIIARNSAHCESFKARWGTMKNRFFAIKKRLTTSFAA
jgi:hypothetical protein